MKIVLRVALVALFAGALYYRFAHHNAVAYYSLYGVCAVVLTVYLFRFGKNSN